MTLLTLYGGSMLVWTMSGRVAPLPTSAPTISPSPLSPLEPTASNRALGRREALVAGVGALASVVALAPQPAYAQRSALIPKQSKEATANFKEYQLSKPGEETEAFKKAEVKRKKEAEEEAAGKPSTRKEETAEETMKRLGIKAYN